MVTKKRLLNFILIVITEISLYFEKNNFKATIIVFWTSVAGKYPVRDEWPFINLSRKCAITYNRNLVKRAKAIVFHGNDMDWEDLPDPSLAAKRVFFTMESVINSFVNLTVIPNYFDLSMTLRSDSDIPCYSGKINKHKKLVRLNTENFINQKTKLVAWIASHCNTSSGRESLVADLAKYLPIDSFGSCGTKSNYIECKKRSLQCEDKIAKTVKNLLHFASISLSKHLWAAGFTSLLYIWLKNTCTSRTQFRLDCTKKVFP